MKRLLVTLIAITLLPACATSPTGRSQLMLISPEAAIVESRKAYLSTVQELGDQDKLVDNPRTVERVRDITGRLVTVAGREYPNTRDWEWSVAIIDDPETVNAWCMAGGRMAVYTGLLDKLKLTDDEFAQVMGHEISHALANHTAEQMSRAMATTLGIMAIGVASDNHGAAMVGASAAAKLAIDLPNSRTAESEADRIGMQIAVEAGFEPDAAVTLWQKMGEAGGSAPPQFLSTHPSPGNREAALKAMIPGMRKLNPDGRMAPVSPVTIEK